MYDENEINGATRLWAPLETSNESVLLGNSHAIPRNATSLIVTRNSRRHTKYDSRPHLSKQFIHDRASKLIQQKIVQNTVEKHAKSSFLSAMLINHVDYIRKMIADHGILMWRDCYFMREMSE